MVRVPYCLYLKHLNQISVFVFNSHIFFMSNFFYFLYKYYRIISVYKLRSNGIVWTFIVITNKHSNDINIDQQVAVLSRLNKFKLIKNHTAIFKTNIELLKKLSRCYVWYYTIHKTSNYLPNFCNYMKKCITIGKAIYCENPSRTS